MYCIYFSLPLFTIFITTPIKTEILFFPHANTLTDLLPVLLVFFKKHLKVRDI